MDRLARLTRQVTVFWPAEHRRQTGAEKLSVQRAFGVALDIDHGRGTGDQVLQAGTGSAGLQLLGFQGADVEQKTLCLAALQLPDPVQPAWAGHVVRRQQAQVQVECNAIAQLLQRHVRGLAVGWVQAGQPLLDAGLSVQAKACSQGWVEPQWPLQGPLPAAGAQLLLQGVEVLGAPLQLVLSKACQQGLGQG